MCSVLKIAAVFATMNRAETAVSCVMALARQTRPPDLVVVADNVSCDDTVAVLNALIDLPFELIVHQMPENSGNAGGVEVVMDLAFSHGVDAVWILDDDSWPRPKALEKLLEGTWDPRVVRHPLQIDPKTGRFTWPMWISCGSGWTLAFEPRELPPGDYLHARGSWTGALVSKQIRSKVGPVRGNLFIRGEDEDYPWRIEKAGYRFETVCRALLDHPGPDRLFHWMLFGRHFFYEDGLTDWKLYYKTRNMVWLKRQKSGIFSAFAIATAYAFASIWLEGPKRLPLIYQATRAGILGILGRWLKHT